MAKLGGIFDILNPVGISVERDLGAEATQKRCVMDENLEKLNSIRIDFMSLGVVTGATLGVAFGAMLGVIGGNSGFFGGGISIGAVVGIVIGEVLYRQNQPA